MFFDTIKRQYMATRKTTKHMSSDELWKEYIRMDDTCWVFRLYETAAQKREIWTNSDNWFWLEYLCLLLRRKKLAKAEEILNKYVGCYKTKDIWCFCQ